MQVKDSPLSDWRVHVLAMMERAVRWPWIRRLFPARLRSAAVALYLLISPSVPASLRRGMATPTPSPATTFWTCYALTFFFCAVVTAVLCGIEGTLYGWSPSLREDPSARRFLWLDGWNLFFYTVVCPTYVSLCVLLISLTINKWSELADFADTKADAAADIRSPYRIYSVVAIAFLLCTVFITTYIQDVLHPSAEVAKRAGVYWFMTDLGGGIRTLNRVGYYYVALNFCLLFITLLGVACFLSLAAEVFRAASVRDVNKLESFQELQIRLLAFTDGYIYIKALAAAYAVNFFVWGMSPLGATGNLLAAQVALTLVGVFFIAVPRQYIELRWYDLWLKSGRPFEFAETRTHKAKLVASVLDAFFISLIVSSWGLEDILRRWFGG